MIEKIEYVDAPVLLTPNRRAIKDSLTGILETDAKGLVVRGTTYRTVANAIRDTGFQYYDGVVFHQTALASEAADRLRTGLPLEGSWRLNGITSVHSDGTEDEQLLAAAHVRKGGLEIRVFERGPDYHRSGWGFTQDILTDEPIDSDFLLPRATRLVGRPGDTLVFKSNHPHMALTLEPRETRSTFFRRVTTTR